VPAIYTEITGEGRCRPADVQRYLEGVQRLLAYLGSTGDRLEAREPVWLVEDDTPQAGFLQVQNRAAVGGFFLPEVEIMQRVEKGQALGSICDAVGVVRQRVAAPHAGLVVFLRTFPRVLAGEPVCTVLEVGSTRR
jgi:predicted deacylase